MITHNTPLFTKKWLTNIKSTPVSLAEMTTIASDIKTSLFAAIIELRSGLQSMSTKLEGAGEQRDRAIKELQHSSLTHQNHLLAIQQKLEELDNRGRRNNIRVRGVPETIPPEDIKILI